jgi:hypothetical protein
MFFKLLITQILQFKSWLFLQNWAVKIHEFWKKCECFFIIKLFAITDPSVVGFTFDKPLFVSVGTGLGVLRRCNGG